MIVVFSPMNAWRAAIDVDGLNIDYGSNFFNWVMRDPRVIYRRVEPDCPPEDVTVPDGGWLLEWAPDAMSAPAGAVYEPGDRCVIKPKHVYLWLPGWSA